MSEAMKTSRAEIASGKQDSSEGIRVTDDILAEALISVVMETEGVVTEHNEGTVATVAITKDDSTNSEEIPISEETKIKLDDPGANDIVNEDCAPKESIETIDEVVKDAGKGNSTNHPPENVEQERPTGRCQESQIYQLHQMSSMGLVTGFEDIPTSRCDTCAQYHCFLCPVDKFKPNIHSRLKVHFKHHWNHRVFYISKDGKELWILRCYQMCDRNKLSKGKPEPHYHCPECDFTNKRRMRFIQHLIKHAPKHRTRYETEEKKRVIEIMEAKTKPAAKEDVSTFSDDDSSDSEDEGTGPFAWRNQVTGMVKKLKDLPLEMCSDPACNCQKYHCVLCPEEHFKASSLIKLKLHYATHWKNKNPVPYKCKNTQREYFLLRCFHDCGRQKLKDNKPQSHYHCPLCPFATHKHERINHHISLHNEDLQWKRHIESLPKPEQIFQFVAGVMNPECMDFIPGSHEAFLGQLKTDTGLVSCAIAGESCVLQGSWEALKLARISLTDLIYPDAQTDMSAQTDRPVLCTVSTQTDPVHASAVKVSNVVETTPSPSKQKQQQQQRSKVEQENIYRKVYTSKRKNTVEDDPLSCDDNTAEHSQATESQMKEADISAMSTPVKTAEYETVQEESGGSVPRRGRGRPRKSEVIQKPVTPKADNKPGKVEENTRSIKSVDQQGGNSSKSDLSNENLDSTQNKQTDLMKNVVVSLDKISPSKNEMDKETITPKSIHNQSGKSSLVAEKRPRGRPKKEKANHENTSLTSIDTEVKATLQSTASNASDNQYSSQDKDIILPKDIHKQSEESSIVVEKRKRGRPKKERANDESVSLTTLDTKATTLHSSTRKASIDQDPSKNPLESSGDVVSPVRSRPGKRSASSRLDSILQSMTKKKSRRSVDESLSSDSPKAKHVSDNILKSGSRIKKNDIDSLKTAKVSLERLQFNDIVDKGNLSEVNPQSDKEPVDKSGKSSNELVERDSENTEKHDSLTSRDSNDAQQSCSNQDTSQENALESMQDLTNSDCDNTKCDSSSNISSISDLNPAGTVVTDTSGISMSDANVKQRTLETSANKSEKIASTSPTSETLCDTDSPNHQNSNVSQIPQSEYPDHPVTNTDDDSVIEMKEDDSEAENSEDIQTSTQEHKNVTTSSQDVKTGGFTVACDETGNLTLTLDTNNSPRKKKASKSDGYTSKNPSRRGRRIVEEGRRTCVCGKVFQTMNAMVKHCAETKCQDPEVARKPFKCSLCSFTAAREVKVEEHFARKHREKSIQCPKCPAKFGMDVHLKQHLLYKHDPEYRAKLAVKQNETIMCDICGKVVKKYRLTEHKKYKHRPPVPKEKKYQCNQCNFKTTTAKILEHHKIRIHSEKNVHCKYCSKMFAMKIDLDTHIAMHHSEVPEANMNLIGTCPICNKRMLKKTVKHHMNMVHHGIKPYPCSICGKRFATRYMTKAHEEAHKDSSERLRRYLCSFCGKRFLQSEQYKAHLNTHTGARPYQCEVCPATFTSKLCLTRHKIVHTQGKDFSCDECGKAFKTEKYLKTHKLRHGRSRQSLCVCGFTVPEQQVFDRHLLKCPAYLGLHNKQKEVVAIVMENVVHPHPSDLGHAAVTFDVENVLHQVQTLEADVVTEEAEYIYLQQDEDGAECQPVKVETEVAITEEEMREGYMCGYCDALFFEVEEIQTHMKDMHGLEVTQVAEDGEPIIAQ